MKPYWVSALALAISTFSVAQTATEPTTLTEKIQRTMTTAQHWQRGRLLSQAFVATIPKDKINAYFPESKEFEGNIQNLPKYDIDLYKITYASTSDHKSVVLSGLIIVPRKAGDLTMLQYHHGTLLPYTAPDGWGSQDAPSLYKGTAPSAYKAHYETRLYGNYLGSNGYLVSLPDYAGYGVSSNVEHPYSYNVELAKQSVDMILATKAFAKQHQLPVKEKMFLFGWSEGGAISVATQKLIEQAYQKQIPLYANASMSGGLNTENLNVVFEQAPYFSQDVGDGLGFLAWVYYAYNKFSEHPVAFDKIFKIPVKNDLDILKKRPSNVPADIFVPMDNATMQHMLAQAKMNNLASGWAPKAPLLVAQGTKDEIVPYENNPETAVDYFKQHNGKAILMKYDNHTHSSLALLQLQDTLKYFKHIAAE